MRAEGTISVSDAVRAYLHWRATPYPASDEEAVRALAGSDEEADILVAEVQRAIEDSEFIELDDAQLRSLTGGEEFRAALAVRRPDLDEDAIRALASRVFFNRLR